MANLPAKEAAEGNDANPSASRSTIVQAAASSVDEKQPHGGEGESAFPEDKRKEALERIDHDWQHDPANPRNWSWGALHVLPISFPLIYCFE